jgi:lysophospholipase L1-like esterase
VRRLLAAALIPILAAGLLAARGAAQSTLLSDATVLVIGDSIGVAMEPYLRRELPGTPIIDDSLGGRPSPDGLEALRAKLTPDVAVIVFAMGTNDNPSYPEIMAGNLATIARIAPDSCIVVPTIARPPVDGVSDAGINRAIRAFAASHLNVEVVDWKAAVRAQPDLLMDGIHATPEGSAVRAALIAQAVDACLISSLEPDSGGGDRPQHGDDSEGRTRPPEPPPADAPEESRTISTERAYKILADTVSSHIAIGALE